MVWMKRIFLFLILNIVIVFTLSLVTNLLGIQPYITAYGMNYQSLIFFCLIWGFGGAFISLALSKVMAKWMMGVKIIDPQKAYGEQRELVDTVYRLSRSAGLTAMPEVGMYDSPEINAFATGPTKSRSLVAVSSGLLHSMSKREVEGVLSHEIAHIANGDMVTMTLVQGVVNAFVMFFARAIAFAITQGTRGRDDNDNRGFSSMSYFMTQMILEIIFMILGSIVVAWFSRQREFRADAGGAKVGGKENMLSALMALKRTQEYASVPHEGHNDKGFQTMKISSGKRGGFLRLFSTHPPLEERIERLQRSPIG